MLKRRPETRYTHVRELRVESYLTRLDAIAKHSRRRLTFSTATDKLDCLTMYMGHISRLLRLRQIRGVRSFLVNAGQKREAKPLDKIDLKRMEFYGFHGIMAREKREGQRFIVDATLFLDLRPAGQKDKLSLTVNYVSVLRDLEKVMKGPSVDLLENLAEMMCYRLLEGYPLIHKTPSNTLVSARCSCRTVPNCVALGVTLFRGRDDFNFRQRHDDSEFDD